MPPVIDPEACVCCGTCENKCPMDVIYMTPEKMEVRYPDECWHCGACRQDCLAEAITFDFSPIMLNKQSDHRALIERTKDEYRAGTAY